MPKDVEIVELEEFDPAYHMGGIVEEMVKAGLKTWSGEKIFVAKTKGKEQRLRIKLSATVEEVT